MENTGATTTAAAATETLFFDVQQKTDKQHILDNPDTYIGAVESVEASLWVVEDADITVGGNGTVRIVEKTFTYIPGLFKLFDEGIVNCRDHVVRMQTKVNEGHEHALPVTHIDVDISQADGTITMTNDGNGIDVAERDGVWIPELVFGHLRTSTNYNKDEKKIVGGKNGFGFKLVLIWSTYGRIETIDHIRGLKYVQEFRANLDVIGTPIITKCKPTQKPYTKITFCPDYARLGIRGLTDDMVSLLQKRVYDIGAVTDKSVRVKYNGTLIPVKTFEQYISLYLGGDKTFVPRVYEADETGGRWEYAVALTPNSEFVQVSFVNGIHTAKGGKHVEYLVNQILRKSVEMIEKKKKVRVNPNTIKEQLILFLRCDIENPSFDSQTKDYMNTPATKFGSKCEVSDKFIEKLIKLGVMDAALQLTQIKETREVQRQDGVKSRHIRGVEKLTDANWAGTDKSHLCTLFLCEGDSAKSGIISGMTEKDRDTIGVFPLRGKLFNVRGESTKHISANSEIANLVKIMGLKYKHEYPTLEAAHKTLRYGRVALFTDQDKDGSHIKGLLVNLFDCEWPSLLRLDGFLGFMNSPILKATPTLTKGDRVLSFYNEGEYEHWKQTVADPSQWKVKYYKGLGTSTALEFKSYMAERRIVSFTTTATSHDLIDMAFNKARADDRKEWLKLYNRQSHLDTSHLRVTYDDFVNQELIHFSTYDCARNIPNVVDGLKLSQRKILYAAFKRNFTSEIKVSQFAGYVSEHACYHHGEASLNQTIIGMAQDFMGSNNINLLVPSGQFGTRLMGGKDSSSERYIFTCLEPIARYLFRPEDDAVLTYLEDDGYPVEPVYYVPILPMILVNGSSGIGTGYSTDVPCFHPGQLIAFLKAKLNVSAAGLVTEADAAAAEVMDTDHNTFVPYYQDFLGSVEQPAPNHFLFKGIYQKLGEDKILVTELPVGKWTADFTTLLETLQEPQERLNHPPTKPVVKEYKPMSTDTVAKFEITLTKGTLQELESIPRDKNGRDGVEKCFKLTSSITLSNQHLFGADEVLHKFTTVRDIIDAHFEVRLLVYAKRKAHLLRHLQHRVTVIVNKTRYIQDVLAGHVDLRGLTDTAVTQLLASRGYVPLCEDETADGKSADYRYLVKMPMDSVTTSKVERMMREKDAKEAELRALADTSERTMWYRDLEDLEVKYAEYLSARAARHASDAGEENRDAGDNGRKTSKKPRVTKTKADAKDEGNEMGKSKVETKKARKTA